MAEPDWEWFHDNFNTKLSEKEERTFQHWLKEESSRRGRDISQDLYTYDVRGFWKGREKTDERGHGTDRYKKPNHITFSNESIYNGGEWNGGSWGKGTFTPGETNLQYYAPEQLQKYFDEEEEEVKLIMPTPAPTPTPEEEAKKTKPRFTQQLQQIFQTSVEDVLARMLGASQDLPPGPEAGSQPGSGPGPLPPALANPGAGDEAAVRERQALEQMFGASGPGQSYVVGQR